MKAKFDRLAYVDLAEQTAVELRRRILGREIESGAQIPVDEVASQLGVSRTPVIEALRQLANEGLVDIVARRGCYVRTLTVHDVREIFEAREAIEIYCARHAICQGRNRPLAERLERLIDEMSVQIKEREYLDIEAFITADRAFHDAIVASVGNQRLSAMYHQLNVHMHVLRVHYFMELEAPPGVTKDHWDICNAITDADVPAADAAIRRHLERIKSKMIFNLQENGGAL